MKVLLPLNLLLLGFLTSCNGYCWMDSLKIINGAGMCEMLGLTYPIGSNWHSEDCMDCSCSKDGLGCCSMYTTPQKFPPECEAVFDKENCRYVVHVKGNPKITCPAFAGVG
uniref:beta-microseminoprotein-like n=1 Tax=Myxine glutinosa TaxID=7769 RepID=UPI00358E2688